MYVLKCARIINLFKKRNPFVVKVNQFTTKFKSVFDSHYQMHIRLTHNRSRHFHISVETNLLFVHISVRTYTYIWYAHAKYVVVKLLVSRKNGHKAHAVPSTLFTFVRFVKEHFVVLLATTRLYLFQRSEIY
jgi:hypothetical protein